MAEPKGTDTTLDRLGTLEREQTRLQSESVGLSKDISALSEKFDAFALEVRGAIGEIRDVVTERGRPQWMVMAAISTALFVVAAAFFQPYAEDLTRLREQYQSHLTEPAHPEIHEKLETQLWRTRAERLGWKE